MMPAFYVARSLVEPQGRTTAMDWSRFAARVQTARPATTKDALARWAPAEFRRSYRARANVLRVHAGVLDLDDGTPVDQLMSVFLGVYVIVHSTFSATAERPRWRVIVPLDRPVDADEYDRVWRWLASALEVEGASPDYGARDASRAWAVPAVPPSGYFVTRVTDGAFASVHDALVAIPEPEPLPEPSRDRGDSYDRRVERARKYLAVMPGAISGSGGHATTFRAALAMCRGFGLEPDDALALLVEIHNPTCAPAWTVHELRHKVRQAHQRARVPFGFLAERGRAA
jgi:hypothetical protein